MRMLHAAFLGLMVLLSGCEQLKGRFATAPEPIGYSGGGFHLQTPEVPLPVKNKNA